MMLSVWRRPIVLVPMGIVAAIVLAVAIALFQPWKLVVDTRVDESLPILPATAESKVSPGRAPARPMELASGRFLSHEHGTTGQVRVLRLPDGRRILRLEDLDTSNGPDLKVWLAAAPTVDGRDGWFVFDDDWHRDLGALKGNVGSQNYEIPRDVDLSRVASVAIWCDRFHVSFGAAALT